MLTSRRGSAQVGLLVVAAAVAAGAAIGHGLDGRTASSGYDLAWLADGPRGQVVQVDPAVGRANVRLQVAQPGDPLTIQQGHGQLVIVDRHTGKITSINLGTLLVGGSRPGRAGSGVKVLLSAQRLYVADLVRGTVQGVDPSDESDIGTPWAAGHPLVDVSVDGQGVVWALDTTSRLSSLRWDAARQTLRPASTRTVPSSGSGSVLVGHERGVTLVGGRGAIVHVGTPHDATLDTGQHGGTIGGPLAAPPTSPDAIVPVADPGHSSVVIVGEKDAIVDDVRPFDCDRPAAPTVFEGRVYVPCSGAHKVLVLDPSGHQVGAAIPLPDGGDPQLTVTGGHLVIDVPGSPRATIVDGNGHTRDIPVQQPGLDVQDPSKPPPPPSTPPAPTPTTSTHGHHPSHGNHPGDTGGGSFGSSGSPAPSGSGSAGTGSGGAAASATVRDDGSVLVTWRSAGRSRGTTTITMAGAFDPLAQVPAGATSATVTTLDAGTTGALAVHGHDASGRETWEALTNVVTTRTAPGPAGAVTTSTAPAGVDTVTLTVSWGAAAAHGAKVTYKVADSSGAGTSAAGTTTRLVVPCPGGAGCSGTVSVTAANAAGASAPVTAGWSVAVAPTTAPTTAPTATPTPEPTTQTPTPEPTTSTPPPPPPTPESGTTMLTDQYTPGLDGDDSEVDVTVAMPASWQSWTGTCQITDNGANPQAVDCATASSTVYFTYVETGNHDYVAQALDSTGAVVATSATLTQHVIYRSDPMCGKYMCFAHPVRMDLVIGGSSPGVEIPIVALALAGLVAGVRRLS